LYGAAKLYSTSLFDLHYVYAVFISDIKNRLTFATQPELDANGNVGNYMLEDTIEFS